MSQEISYRHFDPNIHPPLLNHLLNNKSLIDFYTVKLTEMDRKSLHIFQNSPVNGVPIGWQLLFNQEKNLFECAKILDQIDWNYNNWNADPSLLPNYQSPSMKRWFDQIPAEIQRLKQNYNIYDNNTILDNWALNGLNKHGIYMVYDGVHRALVYSSRLIRKEVSFTDFETLLAISNENRLLYFY